MLLGQNVTGVGFITGALAAGDPGVAALTISEIINNPFLIRNQTRIRDFKIIADTKTNTESFYFQDDYKLRLNITLLGGIRWDYQQSYGKPGEGEPLDLNNFIHNLQPRLGFIWDFTGRGKGKCSPIMRVMLRPPYRSMSTFALSATPLSVTAWPSDVCACARRWRGTDLTGTWYAHAQRSAHCHGSYLFADKACGQDRDAYRRYRC